MAPASTGKIDVLDLLTGQVKSLNATFPHMPFKEKDVDWIANDGTNELNIITQYPLRLWHYSSKRGSG